MLQRWQRSNHIPQKMHDHQHLNIPVFLVMIAKNEAKQKGKDQLANVFIA